MRQTYDNRTKAISVSSRFVDIKFATENNDRALKCKYPAECINIFIIAFRAKQVRSPAAPKPSMPP